MLLAIARRLKGLLLSYKDMFIWLCQCEKPWSAARNELVPEALRRDGLAASRGRADGAEARRRRGHPHHRRRDGHPDPVPRLRRGAFPRGPLSFLRPPAAREQRSPDADPAAG